MLEQAIAQRDLEKIREALAFNTELGIAVGPDIERAHQVAMEIKRDGAIRAVNEVLMRSISAPSSSSTSTALGDEEVYYQSLANALDVAEQCGVPADDPMIAAAKAKLDEYRSGKRKRDKGQAKLAKALDAQSIGALIDALADAQTLGLAGDMVDRARILLAKLREDAAGAVLTATTAQANSPESLPALKAAIERAKRDGVNAHMILEAETRYAKIEKDERTRGEIDRALEAAIASRSLSRLETLVKAAAAAAVNSRIIESARLLIAQLRSQGDKDRIKTLLKDSLKLRSVRVLQHVIKSAVDAGITGELLDRAKLYLETLLAKAEEARTGGDNAMGHGTGSADVDDVSDDEDEDYGFNDDNDVRGGGFTPSSSKQFGQTKRKRRMLFDEEDMILEETLHGIFVTYCHKAFEAEGDASQMGFINAMQFSSIWRLITGEKGNLFKEMQMYKRFDVDNHGALSEEVFHLFCNIYFLLKHRIMRSRASIPLYTTSHTHGTPFSTSLTHPYTTFHLSSPSPLTPLL